MNADATGLFITAVARALQFVGIFTLPDVKGVPSSIEDKIFLSAMQGKLVLSGRLNVKWKTCGLLTSSNAIVRNSNLGPNLGIIAYISPKDEFLSNVQKDVCLPAAVNTGRSLLRTYLASLLSGQATAFLSFS